MSRVKLISAIVPVYKSQEILPETHRRLSAALSALGPDLDHEILFVNDGSPDDAMEVLRAIAASDPHVRVISLSRNFGHQMAITAGLDEARGDVVVTIDDDLQDPPEVIAEMVAKWREGYQVVHGVRPTRRGETIFKRWSASAYYRLMQWLSDTPLPLDTGDFRLMDRAVVDALNGMRESSRYVRGMVAWAGFRQYELTYVREARFSGTGNYTARRLLQLALDGALSFSVRPLQMMTHFGLLVTVIAGVAGVWVVIENLLDAGPTPLGWTSVVVAVLFMGGVQLVSIGTLGAYLGRVFSETKGRPLYLVAERIGDERGDRA